VVMSTGAGKTLAFTLPSSLLKGATTVILSPITALVTSQVRSLQDIGYTCAALESVEQLKPAGDRPELPQFCM
jgi:superfamily II DNA helicase RecQ